MFLWGWGGVSTGAVRAVAAVTLAVQAESVGGTGRGQRSFKQTKGTLSGTFKCPSASDNVWRLLAASQVNRLPKLFNLSGLNKKTNTKNAGD